VKALLIGYGNELCGDDAVGPLAARKVAEWGLPGVCCLDVCQLTPELVDELAEVERVVFVDARLGGDSVAVDELSGGGDAPAGHVSNPRGLLALCEVLHGRRPRGWLVTVPADSLELGVGLSARAELGLRQAVTLLRRLLGCGSP
jgi:hydrogenase maturation protease